MCQAGTGFEKQPYSGFRCHQYFAHVQELSQTHRTQSLAKQGFLCDQCFRIKHWDCNLFTHHALYSS